MKKLIAILSIMMIITLSACNNTAVKEEATPATDTTQVDTVIVAVDSTTLVK